jgi:hypothetical protein
MTKGQTSNKGAVCWGAELVSGLAITWSEKTLSGLETGLGLCAVTENRDTDRDTRSILCQGHSSTVCHSNASWHHSLSLGPSPPAPAETVPCFSQTSFQNPLRPWSSWQPWPVGAVGLGPKDNLSQSKFRLCRRPTDSSATWGDQRAIVWGTVTLNKILKGKALSPGLLQEGRRMAWQPKMKPSYWPGEKGVLASWNQLQFLHWSHLQRFKLS